MITVTNAVIFVQPDRFDVHAARCLDYCGTMRYKVAGLICGDWGAATRMIKDGLAAVIVVSSPAHLEADREPRIEIVPRRMRSTRPRPRLVRAGAR